MYSTTAYLYQQIQSVLLIDISGVGTTFDRRWQPVYAKSLKLNLGVDNVILFQFQNQDQKPVNITGSTFMFRVISTDGATLLLEKPMVILNGTTGRAKVQFTGSELLEVLAQPANYSIQRTQPGGGYSDDALLGVYVEHQLATYAWLKSLGTTFKPLQLSSA